MAFPYIALSPLSIADDYIRLMLASIGIDHSLTRLHFIIIISRLIGLKFWHKYHQVILVIKPFQLNIDRNVNVYKN